MVKIGYQGEFWKAHRVSYLNMSSNFMQIEKMLKKIKFKNKKSAFKYKFANSWVFSSHIFKLMLNPDDILRHTCVLKSAVEETTAEEE